MSLYECHITIPAKAAEAGREIASKTHWKFSVIDGDPVLGKHVFAYLTTHGTDLTKVVARMNEVSAEVKAYGVDVIREKIELIVYDTKVGICVESSQGPEKKIFHQEVDDIVLPLFHAEFTPSRAEIEASLQPVLKGLMELSIPSSTAYIRDSFKPGTYDAVLLEMYKQKLRELEVL
jgi:hypothetical protein